MLVKIRKFIVNRARGPIQLVIALRHFVSSNIFQFTYCLYTGKRNIYITLWAGIRKKSSKENACMHRKTTLRRWVRDLCILFSCIHFNILKKRKVYFMKQLYFLPSNLTVQTFSLSAFYVSTLFFFDPPPILC